MVPVNTLNHLLPDTIDAKIIAESSKEIERFYRHKKVLTHEQRVKLFHELPWVKTGKTPYLIRDGVVFSLCDITKADGTKLKFNPKTMEWDKLKNQ